MRTVHKFLIIGVSTALATGAAGIAVAKESGPKFREFQRYVDAGNTGEEIVVGKRTWRPQYGFTGGTVGTADDLLATGALDPDVARTVLTGARAFSRKVPAGTYQVSLWVRRPAKGAITISAEGKVGATVRATGADDGRARWLKTVSMPVRVGDGWLDLAFGPRGNALQIAALAIEGGALPGTPPAPTPTATPEPTTPSPTSPSPTTTKPSSTSTTTTPADPTKTTSPADPTTTPPGNGKKCTNPVFTTSATNGGWSTAGYYVHNNMWNTSKAGPETLYACSHDNWYVTSTQRDTTEVKTYPNVHKDYDDVRISSFSSLRSTFAATSPHTGIYNVAYDIWINGVASPGGTELMIWTENYKQRPSGNIVATVSLGGRTYDVWKTSDNGYIAFVPKNVMTSGSIDLLEIFNWTISKGWMPASSTVGQIGYGVEICSTNSKPETFSFTDFSITSSR